MRGRGSGFVLLGKGPALDSDCGDDRFVYNGSDRGRGRVFQWYRKAVFQDRLREQGWTKRGCRTGASVHASVTEQQCMAALKLTHEHLARFPASCAMLDSFAGPQCYPQLADDAKYQANDVRIAQAAGEAVPELAMARGQTRCWLQCDCCARWRLVDRRSISAVDPAAFAKPKRGTEDGRDWAAWFAGAPQRYAACRDGHALRLAAQGQTTPPSPDYPPYHASAWRTQQDPRLRTNVDQLIASVRSRRTAANTASARAPWPAPARLHQQPPQCARRLPGTLRRLPAAGNTGARQRNPDLRKKLGNVPSARA